jgi:hypothetical protein
MLYSWREQVRADPSLRPSQEHFSEDRQIFPDDVKQMIANFLRMNVLAQGNPLDRSRLQLLIILLVLNFVVRRILPAMVLSLKCSYHFMNRFLDRANLGFRKTRTT